MIGADGFGYVMERERWHKFPQVGRVEIGDFVEIGANSCVDRAALGVTSIGEGTKLDNMVHVGHNCRIGRHVVVAAQTGFSGGVVVEDYAVIGGQVGIGDKARIESRAVLGSGCGVLTSKIVRVGRDGVGHAGASAEAASGTTGQPRAAAGDARGNGGAEAPAGGTGEEGLMLVVVGGHSRNIGKTRVVAGLIRKLRDRKWTAVKITQYGHGVCANHKARHAAARPEPEHPFALSEEYEPSRRIPAASWRRARSARSGCARHRANCRAPRARSTRFWRRART